MKYQLTVLSFLNSVFIDLVNAVNHMTSGEIYMYI